MKKVLVIFFVGFIVLGACTVALAATDTSNIQVTVAGIDALDVTNGGIITLDQISGNNLSGTADTTARLSYTHNYAISRQITAEVLAGGMPAGTQDITLTAAVTGGAGTVTLVTGGTRNTPAPVVWSNIAAGAISNAVVTYGASATASGTRAGDYTFTVTFTSLDM